MFKPTVSVYSGASLSLLLIAAGAALLMWPSRAWGAEKKTPEKKAQKSSLAIVKTDEKKTPDQADQSKKKKETVVLVFPTRDNPLMEDLSQYERDYHTIIEQWDINRLDDIPYDEIKQCAGNMTDRLMQAIEYIEQHPKLSESVPGFTAEAQRNIARLARFAAEFASAARVQKKRLMIEKWMAMNIVLKKLRKMSWWPKPQKIVLKGDYSKAAEAVKEAD